MDSDIVAEHHPFLRIYKSGKIQRLSGTDTVPASSEPQNGVLSKDVVYSPENNLSVRLFLPLDITGKPRKLPLLIYFHGGAFVIESPFSPTYNSFLTAVVAEAECIAVSVEYSLAPENPIPAAYEDSWVAMKWVFDHFAGSGSEDWLNKYADFSRVFIAGDSAGANISHHMAMKSGEEKLISENVNDSVIKGIILIHPSFWGKDPIDEHDVKDESIRKGVEAIWAIANPNSVDGVNDRWINVVGSGLDFSRLSAERVLVFVAGKDMFVRRGCVYAAELEKSQWEGEVEVVEHKEEEHVFHLRNPNCGNAQELVKKFAGFINGKK